MAYAANASLQINYVMSASGANTLFLQICRLRFVCIGGLCDVDQYFYRFNSGKSICRYI